MIVMLFVFLLGVATGLNVAQFIRGLRVAKVEPEEQQSSDSKMVDCRVAPGVISLDFPTSTLIWMLDQKPHAIDFPITVEMHKILTPPTLN